MTVIDAVVVTNVDGTDARALPLPSGADSGAAGEAVSWSPDGSAVVVAGCRPCNYSDPGGKRTDVTHSHLFIVPIDGSRVRELLDETSEGVGAPVWSPDGTSIIVARNDCAAKEVQPYCFKGRLTVATVNVADGAQTILADAPAIASGPSLSPDGRRIAFGIQRQDVPDEKGGIFAMDVDGSHLVRLTDGFLPRWSPDGNWVLFEAPLGDLWIVPADGGEPLHLGSGLAAAW